MKKLFLLFNLLLFISCATDDSTNDLTDDSTEDPISNPTLIVSVESTSAFTAVINWQVEGNSSPVVFEIVINEVEVVDDFSGYQYEFTQLDENTEYSGKVFAKFQSGLNTFGEFSFTTGYFEYRVDSQWKADNFDVTSVEGVLFIGKAYPPFNSDITDLSGLSELVSARYITITNNPLLENLNGLENVVDLNTLYMSNNNQLNDVSALSNLEEGLESLQVTGAQSLTSLSGIKMKTNAGIISLEGCGIENFNGFTAPVNLRSLELERLVNLTSISGLNNVDRISQNLIFDGLVSLPSFNGLTNLRTVGGDIDFNRLIFENFQGMGNLTTTKGLIIENCQNLTSMAGLSAFTDLERLNITNLSNLTSFQGLGNVTNAKELYLRNLPAITDLSGFDNLTYVHRFDFLDCDALTSLDGTILTNDPYATENNFSIINAYNNNSLSDYCAFTDYANNIEFGLYVNTSGNQYNPTKEMIQSETLCSQ